MSPHTHETMPVRIARIKDRRCRMGMAHAWTLAQRNDYTACVSAFCDAAGILFQKRMAEVNAWVFRRLSWPSRKLQLLRTETGLRIVAVAPEFTYEDCEALADYLLSFYWYQQHRDIPGLELKERCLLSLEKFSRHCIQPGRTRHSIPWPGLPPFSRRQKYLLHLVNKLRHAMLLRIPLARSAIRARAELVAMLFHEPKETALNMLREHNFHTEYNYARRLGHLASADHRNKRHLTQFRWAERDSYNRLIHSSSSSRVLLTIHMGDFHGAFKYIGSLCDASRTVTSLKREGNLSEVRQLFPVNTGNHQVLRHGKDNPAKVVGALRKGNHTLTALFDLKEEFGETVRTTFMGHPARFVKGPAELAILGQAPILPFVSYQKDGIDFIDMAPAIDTTCLPGEALESTVQRITQQLVTLAEQWIRQYPTQWKYLDSIAAYLDPVSPTGDKP